LTRARALSSPSINKLSTSILFISFVWPEPSSSAAGVRTMSLIDACLKSGYKVHYLACANPNHFTEKLKLAGVEAHHVAPNRGEEFDAVCRREPFDAVIFDRFLAEEAFSARVRESLPLSARILDMQVTSILSEFLLSQIYIQNLHLTYNSTQTGYALSAACKTADSRSWRWGAGCARISSKC
jgi:hypothetical protein